MPLPMPATQSGKSFQFDHVGASVTGVMIAMEEQQQRDIKTNEPKTWPDGKPMMMTVLTLQTQLRDDSDDDGKRTVYLRGSASPDSGSTLAAFLQAAKQAGITDEIPDGTSLTLTYVGDGVGSSGFTAKRYSGSMKRAGLSVPGTSPDTMPPPTVQQATPADAPAAASPVNGTGDVPGMIGWLNGKVVDAAMQAAFAAAGVDPRTMPGFIAAP